MGRFGTLATPFVDNMRLSGKSAANVATLFEEPEWAGRGFAYLDGLHVKPPSPDALRDELLDGFERDVRALLPTGMASAAS